MKYILIKILYCLSLSSLYCFLVNSKRYKWSIEFKIVEMEKEDTSLLLTIYVSVNPAEIIDKIDRLNILANILVRIARLSINPI